MHEAVSDILNERAQAADGMSRMLLLSLAGHAALIAVLVFVPDLVTSSVEQKATPMMITLGGAEGPDAGGRNTISNRPVQRIAEPDAKPERPSPPAAKAPEMTVPDPVAKPAAKTPPKEIQKPRETAPPRNRGAAGAEIKSGAARVETGGAQIPFGGLATGGGGTGGARTDVANFCCPSYLASIVTMIKRNWNDRQSVRGQNTIKFVVQRDGRITDIAVEESGGQLLDIASQRALLQTKQVTPLPPEFTGNTLTIYLIFEYTR